MNTPRPVRIVGVGSPHGDDGVAWEVVRSLRSMRSFADGIELHLIEGGQRFLDVLDGRGTLILVDAIDADTEPGTIHRFEWPDARLEALRPGSTHDMKPAEALRLAEALGLLPPRVVIFGIELESLSPLPILSERVLAVVPALMQEIVAELGVGSIEQVVATNASIEDR